MTPVSTRHAVAVAILGAQATIAQIVVVRAGLERFGGNEFFIGAALAVWLVSGAIGAGLFGGLADSPGRRANLIRTGAALTAVGTVLALFVLNILATGFQSAGVAPHPAVAAGWIALATMFPGSASGVMFAWLVPVLSEKFDTGLERATLFESAGAAAGGLVVGTVLSDVTGSPGLMACVIFFTGIAIHLIAPLSRGRMTAVWIATATATAATAWVTMSMVPVPPGFSKIDSIENRHGRFVAVSRENQVTVLSGSRTVVDCQDERGPEILAATALALMPDATDIAVAGGCGQDLSLISGLPGRRVALITPNPQLDDMAAGLCGETSRPARIIDTPMHHFSKSQVRRDMIMLRTGMPDTIDRAGLISKHGMSVMKQALKPDGLLAASMGPVQAYPTDAALRVLARVLETGRQIFPECSILPIGEYWLVCGQKTPDSDRIVMNADALPFQARFATTVFFADAMNPFNLERLSEKLQAARSDEQSRIPLLSGGTDEARVNARPCAIDEARVNARPCAIVDASIVLDTMLDWAGRHTPAAATARSAPNHVVALAAVAAVPVLLLIMLAVGLLKRPRVLAVSAVAVTGAAGLAVELALMWAVQSAYGSLHFWLAALIAAYMAGLGAGAWAAWRAGRNLGHGRVLRFSLQAQAVLTVAAIGACVALTTGIPGQLGLALTILVLTMCAAASGAAFQAAAQHTKTVAHTGTARLVGSLRAIDTAAAAFAAVACSFFLLPVAGTPAVLTSCAISCAILSMHGRS